MLDKLIEIVQNQRILYDTGDPNYAKSKLKDEIWNKIAIDLNLLDGNEAKDMWSKLRKRHRRAIHRHRKGGADVKPWEFQDEMEFLLPYMSIGVRDTHLESTPSTPTDTPNKMKPKPQNDLYFFFMSMYETTKTMPLVSQHLVRNVIFQTVSQVESELLNIASCEQFQHSCYPSSYICNEDEFDALAACSPSSTPPKPMLVYDDNETEDTKSPSPCRKRRRQ